MITKENKNFTINLKEGLISQGFKSDVVNNIIEDFVNFAKGGFSKIKVTSKDLDKIADTEVDNGLFIKETYSWIYKDYLLLLKSKLLLTTEEFNFKDDFKKEEFEEFLNSDTEEYNKEAFYNYYTDNKDKYLDNEQYIKIKNSANSSRYLRALKNTIVEGGKYKDLVIIEPQDFDLPQQWEENPIKDKETAILWALSETLGLNESMFIFNTINPNIRLIAQDIGAPYSVILKAFKMFCF